MTNTFGCTVKKTTNCVAETRQDCKYIRYQECQEVPVYNCKPAHVHKPTQELLHRKKCLLPDSQPGMTSAHTQRAIMKSNPLSTKYTILRATYVSVPQYQPSYGSPAPSFEAPLPAKQ